MGKLAQRKSNKKAYKQRFLIVHEGKETEDKYIQHIKKLYGIERSCCIETYYPKHTSISALIQKMSREAGVVQERDRLWIVVDRDEKNHMHEQFAELADWEAARAHNYVAISNPRFEYWLLLHVMAHPNGALARDDSYVRSVINGYTKDLSRCLDVFTKESSKLALARAEAQGWPTCENPEKIGSGMGVLVQQMANEA